MIYHPSRGGQQSTVVVDERQTVSEWQASGIQTSELACYGYKGGDRRTRIDIP